MIYFSILQKLSQLLYCNSQQHTVKLFTSTPAPFILSFSGVSPLLDKQSTHVYLSHLSYSPSLSPPAPFMCVIFLWPSLQALAGG